MLFLLSVFCNCTSFLVHVFHAPLRKLYQVIFSVFAKQVWHNIKICETLKQVLYADQEQGGSVHCWPIPIAQTTTRMCSFWHFFPPRFDLKIIPNLKFLMALTIYGLWQLSYRGDWFCGLNWARAPPQRPIGLPFAFTPNLSLENLQMKKLQWDRAVCCSHHAYAIRPHCNALAPAKYLQTFASDH